MGMWRLRKSAFAPSNMENESVGRQPSQRFLRALTLLDIARYWMLPRVHSITCGAIGAWMSSQGRRPVLPLIPCAV